MKVRLNEDKQVVDAIREGLKRTGGKPLHVQGVQGSDRGSQL